MEEIFGVQELIKKSMKQNRLYSSFQMKKETHSATHYGMKGLPLELEVTVTFESLKAEQKCLFHTLVFRR
jgi:hypothetical protein